MVENKSCQQDPEEWSISEPGWVSLNVVRWDFNSNLFSPARYINIFTRDLEAEIFCVKKVYVYLD